MNIRQPLINFSRYNKNGSALLNVIITLVVISVYLMIIASIFNSNLREAKVQEDYLKAYSLAVAGYDLTYAALIQEGTGGKNDTLLYQNFSVASKPNISTTPTFTDTMTMSGGVVNITVKAFDKDGERWVEIESVASLTESSVKKTAIYQFVVANPLIQIKS